MKGLGLFCLLFLSCMSSRGEGNIDSLFKALNKGEVSIMPPQSFSDFSGTKIDDTTCYFIGDNIENAQIAYCQSKAREYTIDMLHVNGRNYKLFANPEDDKAYNMLIDDAKLYHLKTKTRKYVCISGKITLNNKRGDIYSYVLLDVTDPRKVKVGQLLSYFSSIYSFADLNNDGELDFIKVRPYKQGTDNYIAEACNLDGDKITTGSNKGYSISMKATAGVAEVTDEKWFE